MSNKELFITVVKKEFDKLCYPNDDNCVRVDILFNNTRIKGHIYKMYSAVTYNFSYAMWCVSVEGKKSNWISVFDTEFEANNYCKKTKLKTSIPKLKWSFTDGLSEINKIIDKMDTSLKVVKIITEYCDEDVY